jgi:hypothetical protein
MTEGTEAGGEVRVGRRTLERRGPAGRWREVRGVGIVLLLLLASAVLVVWGIVRAVGPAIGLDPAGGATVDALGRPMVDVPVDNVLARLPDGRQARGSFWLRMRQEAAPGQLVQIARSDRPTPTPERGARPPGPIQGASAEVRTREAVNNAMSGLRYEELVGDAGKDRLKSAVRDAVNGALPEAPVEQVYIRELIVQ